MYYDRVLLLGAFWLVVILIICSYLHQLLQKPLSQPCHDSQGCKEVTLRCTSNSFQFKILYYFSKIEYHFGEVVQNFELKRVGGAPKGY